MASRTYSQSISGFKAFKDILNSAEFTLKSFLIYHSDNPCFQEYLRIHMPVYCRSQRKARMTRGLLEGWFINCNIPQVQKYCSEKDIPFKILLLLDNASGHQHRDKCGDCFNK